MKKIHFVGIGGISMSGLAKFCLKNGYVVSGSDRAKNGELENLSNLGIKIYKGHSEKNVYGKDLVVYTSAISDDNAEVNYALKNGIKVLKRSELLGYILKEYKNSIGVSGSHGKTTATAMISEIFIVANKDPTVFLGGEYGDYGNFRAGKKEFAIAESCEYKKNFLDIFHTVSVVLNIDNDHVESFNGELDMEETFKKFMGKTLSVVNADDKRSKKLFNGSTVYYGIKNQASIMAKRIVQEESGYSFLVYVYGKKLGRINLNVLGYHNIYNALASITVANAFGIDFKYIKKGLENFNGVKRRSEFICELDNKKWFCDYAHHPSEIRAILKTFNAFDKKTLVIFQPHTYSRTKLLKKEFIDCLLGLDNLIIYKTYPAREKFDREGSAKSLSDGLPDAVYIDSKIKLLESIKNCDKNVKKILFLGAGDIYQIALILKQKYGSF